MWINRSSKELRYKEDNDFGIHVEGDIYIAPPNFDLLYFLVQASVGPACELQKRCP